MNRILIAPLLAAAMFSAGCEPVPPSATLRPAAAAPAPMMAPAARSPAALDRSTEAERQAALAPSATGARLGRVSVALGAPAEQGFWLRSALVSAERPGRVQTADGRSVAVVLKPGAGAATLSLAAFRALNLSLTDLPEVTVFGG